ncbi:MAG: spermidine/putrescine ABC transporter substrate-binding protein [Oscillospiraceae bacterium]|nr:spermidine/putrescine ABC transporter substrate-binding protein [Oscillospiraceae bacterium]
MKKFVSLILSVFVIVSLLCSVGCGKKYDATIIVYNWGGPYMSEGSNDTVDINELFEEKYNVKVKYRTYDSNESMYAKLKNGGADYDIIIPSDYMVARLISEGLVEKLDFSNIPLFETNVMDNFKNPDYDPTNEYSVPYSWGAVGIVYNKEVVKEEVKSWSILWDEKYKDNVLMFNNSRDAFMVSEMLLGYSQNTTNKDEIKAAADKLSEQKSVVQGYYMDEIYDKMINEDAAIATYYAGDALVMMEENENLAFAYPEEGTNRFVDAVCIPKGSKNKKYAEMYINFLLEAEIALANCEVTGYCTPNSAAFKLLDDETKNNKIMYPDDEYLKKCESYIHLPSDVNTYVQELWINIKTEG